ncbi:GNAT family N-acetyltransferase [Mycolicibacterium komossense]|uniref:GNAT family N-acetyltransferase n=1 Tax=Mycolicibacterium komossense TaxID=1779 RepID=A0ABT3CM30_9MYCO|nr:GNAT family N-acetyltransferase [Mycolicibacterium komossense]MCV7230403.1 GNAT family N-acetyltransferase [Mycolicibacterium komossense]
MTSTTQLPAGVTVRSATDADWAALKLLAATCFGSFRDSEVTAMWRSMMPTDGVVVASVGSKIVGMAMYLDLRLTVPGGAVLPAAGVTWVAVSPTHRRRGILRVMFDELHHRIIHSGYPIAALMASEGGIYGRFGYGPAVIEQRLRVQRRWARFHSEVLDSGNVDVVCAAEHAEELAAIDERWRERTPGGLHTPPAMWAEVLADRESARHGGSPLFTLLHPDGYAMYRVHADTDSVEVTRFVAATAGAHPALWRVLLGLDLIDTIAVHTHPADQLPYLLTDARHVETLSSRDSLWLRIIDIPAALRARTYQADVSAVMDIRGPGLAESRFTVTIREGNAHVAPTDDPPDFYTDLSVLSSIYLGAHRPSAFASANRLRCNDDRLLRQLDLAFASNVAAQVGYDF